MSEKAKFIFSIGYKIARNIYYKSKKYFAFIASSITRNRLNLEIKRQSSIKSKDFSSGYIYTAFGETFYQECINSVRILKQFTTYPIHLFTDQENIPEEEKELFYSIKNVPSFHVRSKIDYIYLSPFENTIYLDTDIIIAQSIDDLFQLLNYYPILATLDTARKRDIMSKSIPEYEEIPYAFGEVNTGLIGFNNHAKNNILVRWPKLFYKYMNQSGGWDQPSFRILLWETKTKIYILPPEYNIRSLELLERLNNSKSKLGKDHMAPRVYHMHINPGIYKGEKLDINPNEIINLAKEKCYKIIY